MGGEVERKIKELLKAIVREGYPPQIYLLASSILISIEREGFTQKVFQSLSKLFRFMAEATQTKKAEKQGLPLSEGKTLQRAGKRLGKSKRKEKKKRGRQIPLSLLTPKKAETGEKLHAPEGAKRVAVPQGGGRELEPQKKEKEKPKGAEVRTQEKKRVEGGKTEKRKKKQAEQPSPSKGGWKPIPGSIMLYPRELGGGSPVVARVGLLRGLLERGVEFGRRVGLDPSSIYIITEVMSFSNHSAKLRMVNLEYRSVFGWFKVYGEALGAFPLSLVYLRERDQTVIPLSFFSGRLEEKKVLRGDHRILVVSDLHISSSLNILHEGGEFRNREALEKIRELSETSDLVVFVGDNIEGVGMYLGQEKHLLRLKIEEQVELFSEFLDRAGVERYIITSGDHEARFIPIPPFPYSILGHKNSFPSPLRVEVGGAKLVFFHAPNIHSASNFVFGGGDQIVMTAESFVDYQSLLLTSYYPLLPAFPEDIFYLPPDTDLLILGHTHRHYEAERHRVRVVGAGCLQKTTDLQRRLGVTPDIGVLLVEIGGGELKTDFVQL